MTLQLGQEVTRIARIIFCGLRKRWERDGGPGRRVTSGFVATSESAELNVPEISDPALSEYWPSERRAILVHRFFLGLELKRPIPLGEAVRSWEVGPADAWRTRKARHDCARQKAEISRHKWNMSARFGRDVGWEAAAEDWVLHHAAKWRRWWEQQPESGA